MRRWSGAAGVLFWAARIKCSKQLVLMIHLSWTNVNMRRPCLVRIKIAAEWDRKAAKGLLLLT